MRSIIQTDNERCYLCEMAIGTEEHHIFPGNPNRKYSEQDGMKVRLCRECHEKIHCGKNGRADMLKIMKDGQKKWEEYYAPIIDGDPRKKFMERYGRNWL